MADPKTLAFDLGPAPSLPIAEPDDAQEPVADASGSAPMTDPTHCSCGALFIFDPLLEGETCGGLRRIGWLTCSASCGQTCVSKRGTTAGAWKLAASGRSIDVGGSRLRAEGGDAAAVLARIVRLPELEAALRQIARGEGDAAAIARAALGVA